jgi:hypothetical protein
MVSRRVEQAVLCLGAAVQGGRAVLSQHTHTQAHAQAQTQADAHRRAVQAGMAVEGAAEELGVCVESALEVLCACVSVVSAVGAEGDATDLANGSNTSSNNTSANTAAAAAAVLGATVIAGVEGCVGRAVAALGGSLAGLGSLSPSIPPALLAAGAGGGGRLQRCLLYGVRCLSA